MDHTHIDDTEESFRVFQSCVIDEYDSMVDEFGLVVIDARQSIEDQQVQMREAVAQTLAGASKMELTAPPPNDRPTSATSFTPTQHCSFSIPSLVPREGRILRTYRFPEHCRTSPGNSPTLSNSPHQSFPVLALSVRRVSIPGP